MIPQTLDTGGRHVRGNIYIKLPRRRDFRLKPSTFQPPPSSSSLFPLVPESRPAFTRPLQPLTGPHSAPVSAPAFHFPSLLFFHYTIHAVLPPILINTIFYPTASTAVLSLFPCVEKKKKNLKRVALHSLRPSPLLTFSLELSLLSLPLPPTNSILQRLMIFSQSPFHSVYQGFHLISSLSSLDFQDVGVF